ncbi:MAG: hypothetical protein JOZ18_12750 [Chloroflexi bacterium]|nr:hypothetical protein [Chloroflexota bacterium]
MTPTQITTLLLVGQAFITFLIAVRAFFLYARVRSDLLFILAVSMSTIALVGLLGIIGDNYVTSFSTKWFRYTAQIVSYTFVFLCSVRSSEDYLRRVKQWQLVFTVLLVGMLLLAPLLPQLANSTLEAVVSSLRSVVSFIICLNYAVIFMQKETRFSFLMALAFMLITFGIWITTPWYFQQTLVTYLYVGDSMRTVGLITLLLAFLFG